MDIAGMMGPVPPAVCHVRWTAPRELTAAERCTLSEVERARSPGYRRPEDRRRFETAAALLRQVVADAAGTAPADVVVDRRCATCGRQHGRPLLPGTDLEVSVTHAQDVVGVALTRAGPVGLDVEPVAVDVGQPLLDAVCHPDDAEPTPASFAALWTRKEAVVKATGDGIGAGLRDVRVSPVDVAPALLAYPGRPYLRAQLADVAPAPGYAACVAVLTASPVTVDAAWIGRTVDTAAAGAPGRCG